MESKIEYIVYNSIRMLKYILYYLHFFKFIYRKRFIYLYKLKNRETGLILKTQFYRHYKLLV